MNKRDLYIEKIKPYINKKLIKVLTGQRRAGKSCILQLLAPEIQQNSPEANIIFIDKEKYEFDNIKNYNQLMDYINSAKKEKMNYLFIDEIQDIDGFEIALRSLYSEENFDIYCTGSNSRMFSSEISTYLSGRQIEFHIGSLNFREFCQFHNLEANSNSLVNFLKYGGLPYLIHLPDEEKIRYEYLSNIQSTILFRDIVNRHQIRDTRFLSDLLKYVADNTGSIFSANKISTYLKNQKISKNVALILDYLHHLESAYLINKIQRTDIQGKRLFEVGEKYYFEDIGIRNSLIPFSPKEIGKIIENVVFLHIRNQGFEVKVGILETAEIDFVASRNGENIYIQVAYLLSDDSTIEREFGNLLKIPDNYPKYVVSFDSFSFPNTYKGIKHFTLLEFLQENL